MISHDLPMVARFTQRMVVMRHGEVKETGNTDDLLEHPKAPIHPRAAAGHAAPPARARGGADDAPVVQVRNLVIDYPGHRRLFAKAGAQARAARHRSRGAAARSGRGRRRLGFGQDHAGPRHCGLLIQPSGGEILFRGRSIARSDAGWLDYRLQCQMVFQDPYASLDPRMTIGQLVGEGLRLVKGMSSADKAKRVAEVLDEVGLGTQPIRRAMRTSSRAASGSAWRLRGRWCAGPRS
jgi:peptide/nickel transport system ATP-binding protein